MIKYLIVTADENDRDYISQKTKVSDEDLEKLKPIIEAIKNCKDDHNFLTEECLKHNESPIELYHGIKWFEKTFVPHNEYGFHGIESIELLIVQEEIKLL